MDETSARERTDPDAPELAGSDRRHLRRLAHALDPVVQIGAAGSALVWCRRSIAHSPTTSS